MSYEWVMNTSFYTETPFNKISVYTLLSNGSYGYGGTFIEYQFGVRPLITIN